MHIRGLNNKKQKQKQKDKMQYMVINLYRSYNKQL